MKVFGLIGFPLGHSWSPGWFTEKFRHEGKTECEYRLFPLAKIQDFNQLLYSELGLEGLNVTIPYKTSIMPFLDEIDPVAEAIGAVNTITISRIGGKIKTKGYNTDAEGFELTLEAIPPVSSALILGTGGASKAIAHVLKSRKIAVKFVSRNAECADCLAYKDLDEELLPKYPLIINATPVGMFPSADLFPPIPYEHLTENHCLYDLIYNPPETVFLKKGREAGAFTINGLMMLENQAELAYRIFMK